MKKRTPIHISFYLLLCCALLLVCVGCTQRQSEPSDSLEVVATTYPLYALASTIAAEAEHITISRLNTGQVSCLHDYTLTVSDMRRLEQADLLLLNGGGLEEFLSQVLEQLDGTQLDCSTSIDLLEADEDAHHDHHYEDHDDHDHEHDPHYWMDPRNAALAAQSIAERLSAMDPSNAALYQENAALAVSLLESAYTDWQTELEGLSCPYLITFHDGFRYFTKAFGLELLFAIEEEDGATASAKDIRTAAELVKEYYLPVIFMEANGSGAAARAVSGETGAAIGSLSMLMDGPSAEKGASAEDILTALYLTPMGENITTLAEVLK